MKTAMKLAFKIGESKTEAEKIKNILAWCKEVKNCLARGK